MKKSVGIIFVCWTLSLLALWFSINTLTLNMSLTLWIIGAMNLLKLWHGDAAQWQKLAYRDELTSLLNRRGFLAMATAVKAPFCLLMLDVDGFKSINDEQGHPAGDALLARLGELLIKHSRHGDLCARWGGDEFIVLLTHADSYAAPLFLSRLNKELVDLNISITMGVADTHNATKTDLTELIALADKDLLSHKQKAPSKGAF